MKYIVVKKLFDTNIQNKKLKVDYRIKEKPLGECFCQSRKPHLAIFSNDELLDF